MGAMHTETGGSRPVVVYDGACAFCLRQVERIRRRDRAGVFEFVPRQTAGLEQRFPKLAEGDFNTGMRLVHRDGSVSVGADAVYEIARRPPDAKMARASRHRSGKPRGPLKNWNHRGTEAQR
jgi:predicted DCC family thiol-disulfide oxidoreductase YuxK